MRIQLDMRPVELGDAERLTPEQMTDLAERLRDRLVAAGFTVELTEDRADVDDELPDWALLDEAERAAGGFGYPEVAVAGPAAIVVSVFLRSVFLSTEPEFDAEQTATAQVVSSLRAIDPLVMIPAEQWQQIEQYAAGQAVGPDGTVLRSILSWSALSKRAIALFDEQLSPEYRRPEPYAGRLAALREQCAGLPPFRAAIAADPTGSSFGLDLPEGPAFTRELLKPLRTAMRSVLTDAIAEADERIGLPTGLVLDHDDTSTKAGTAALLVYDNLVDSGAVVPSLREAGHRTAPFSWEDITATAARRDPEYQPSWLPAAVALLAEGGTDVTINTEVTITSEPAPELEPEPEPEPEPAPEPQPPTRLRDRARRLFGG